MNSIVPTENQVSVMQHALGLNDADDERPARRRHFVAGPDHDDWDALRANVAAGLMTERPGSVLTGGDPCFIVTDAGERVARDAWASTRRRLTRSQRRYRAFLAADCGLSFSDWITRRHVP